MQNLILISSESVDKAWDMCFERNLIVEANKLKDLDYWIKHLSKANTRFTIVKYWMRSPSGNIYGLYSDNFVETKKAIYAPGLLDEVYPW